MHLELKRDFNDLRDRLELGLSLEKIHDTPLAKSGSVALGTVFNTFSFSLFLSFSFCSSSLVQGPKQFSVCGKLVFNCISARGCETGEHVTLGDKVIVCHCQCHLMSALVDLVTSVIFIVQFIIDVNDLLM